MKTSGRDGYMDIRHPDVMVICDELSQTTVIVGMTTFGRAGETTPWPIPIQPGDPITVEVPGGTWTATVRDTEDIDDRTTRVYVEDWAWSGKAGSFFGGLCSVGTWTLHAEEVTTSAYPTPVPMRVYKQVWELTFYGSPDPESKREKMRQVFAVILN